MKELIKKWLGICEHETWSTVGTILADLEGTEYLIEKCDNRSCGFINIYKL